MRVFTVVYIHGVDMELGSIDVLANGELEAVHVADGDCGWLVFWDAVDVIEHCPSLDTHDAHVSARYHAIYCAEERIAPVFDLVPF